MDGNRPMPLLKQTSWSGVIKSVILSSPNANRLV
ncbi:Uncharacterised protein [Vibrio cholerae]|nr:Uncharacterised protein [Vibrio cholerae]CSI45855.1 Uncharacterised protein [Vibrio cholerae]